MDSKCLSTVKLVLAFAKCQRKKKNLPTSKTFAVVSLSSMQGVFTESSLRNSHGGSRIATVSFYCFCFDNPATLAHPRI